MEEYIRKFEKGTQFVKIHQAVTRQELTDLNDLGEDYLNKVCMKFIPASGAATRMFKDLYTYLDKQEATDFVDHFFDHLSDFAFYEDLSEMIAARTLDLSKAQDRCLILQWLLEEHLNYGNLPKALIKMHQYHDFVATPIDEHIFEGEKYLNPNKIQLHFTISQQHEGLFMAYCDKALRGRDHIEITHSFQKEKTDTLAVDLNNKPFVLEDGKILYRAGGHGALIENLNDLDADIIFIKNIDNVCHQSKSQTTLQAKKKLAAIGAQVKAEIDAHIRSLESGSGDLEKTKDFLGNTLNIQLKVDLTKAMALKFLKRPLRVCGVVKNEGEPGGGPFVVDNGDYLDLQICEMAEIDLARDGAVLQGAQFFNPVDLVCFVKDHKGEKFNLLNYINEARYFISEKTYKGKKLKALEHPGLWNGAMHHWNTLFVEVPLSTFNPVKTVNDLLRPGHMKA